LILGALGTQIRYHKGTRFGNPNRPAIKPQETNQIVRVLRTLVDLNYDFDKLERMKITDIERREFLADPELRLVDIPEQAALLAGGITLSHDELAAAVKDAQKEYRAKNPRRRLPSG
jgi:hypothetical protein